MEGDDKITFSGDLGKIVAGGKGQDRFILEFNKNPNNKLIHEILDFTPAEKKIKLIYLTWILKD